MATTCEAGNHVLFTKWGSYIIRADNHNFMEMDRIGNIYTIDAFDKDEGRKPEQDFARQVTAP